MPLSERLAQLDAELDAFGKSADAIAEVRALLLSDRSSDLAAIDTELDALAADVAGLDAVLSAARAEADSRISELSAIAAAQAEEAKATRQAAEARVAALAQEQAAAAQARETRSADEMALKASRAEAREAERLAREAELEEMRASREADKAAREAAAEQAATELAAAEQAEASAPVQNATEGTDMFGEELFADLGADAFDAPQEPADDLVTSEAPEPRHSVLGDLAGLLEEEENAAQTAAESIDVVEDADAESGASDDVMNALFDIGSIAPPPMEDPEAATSEVDAAPAEGSATEVAVESAPPVARPRTVPPPVPGSVRPPAVDLASLAANTALSDTSSDEMDARESFEDLSDEIELLAMDDFDIVIDDDAFIVEDDETLGTELDGAPLSAQELIPPASQQGDAEALQTAVDSPATAEEDEEIGEDGEKKGFFKKLFG